jgi:hypothetical protein
MAITYHLKIKKDYAAALIEDLEKVEAVEFITSDDVDNTGEISEWQKQAVLSRLQDAENKPQQLISWQKANDILEKLKS